MPSDKRQPDPADYLIPTSLRKHFRNIILWQKISQTLSPFSQKLSCDRGFRRGKPGTYSVGSTWSRSPHPTLQAKGSRGRLQQTRLGFRCHVYFPRHSRPCWLTKILGCLVGCHAPVECVRVCETRSGSLPRWAVHCASPSGFVLVLC